MQQSRRGEAVGVSIKPEELSEEAARSLALAVLEVELGQRGPVSNEGAEGAVNSLVNNGYKEEMAIAAVQSVVESVNN